MFNASVVDIKKLAKVITPLSGGDAASAASVASTAGAEGGKCSAFVKAVNES